MESVYILYFVVAMLLFFSLIGTSLSARIGVPLLVVFLLVGMLAGEDGLGIPFKEFTFANALGQAALAVILLDGGLRTSFKQFRLALKPAAVLASWGVLLTVLILGIFVTWVLEVDWRLGFLLAAIVGSTDAAAVFSLLRNGGVRLHQRVQATLEIESGANDPMAILLVLGFISLNLDPGSMSVFGFVKLLIQQLGVGLILGLSFGYLLSLILPRLRLLEGMYALLIFSGGMMVFSATNMLNGSGFLAIYLVGVMIGNRKARATEHVLKVMDGMAWLAQSALFVMLGLLVTPSQLINIWQPALLLFLVLFLVARPLAVFSSLKFFRFQTREMLFISWVGLRGAVPVTLAIMPVMMGVQDAPWLFNVVFAMVCLSLLIQGMTIPFVARFFKVKIPVINEPASELEIWVSNNANIFIYEFVVKKGSFVIGRHPDEIANYIDSDEVRLFAFVRAGKVEAIDNTTSLRSNDRIWYIVKGNHATNLARIFNNALLEQQENSQFFGEWVISPNVLIGDLSLFQDDPAINSAVKAQTVANFIKNNLNRTLVVGDMVAINQEWNLIVREINEDDELLSVGLKWEKKKASKSDSNLSDKDDGLI